MPKLTTAIVRNLTVPSQVSTDPATQPKRVGLNRAATDFWNFPAAGQKATNF
jgi:hypothetical protein